MAENTTGRKISELSSYRGGLEAASEAGAEFPVASGASNYKMKLSEIPVLVAKMISASLSGTITQQEFDVFCQKLQRDINALLDDKQDKLTAGSNITIDGNVISAASGDGSGSGGNLSNTTVAISPSPTNTQSSNDCWIIDFAYQDSNFENLSEDDWYRINATVNTTYKIEGIFRPQFMSSMPDTSAAGRVNATGFGRLFSNSSGTADNSVAITLVKIPQNSRLALLIYRGSTTNLIGLQTIAIKLWQLKGIQGPPGEVDVSPSPNCSGMSNGNWAARVTGRCQLIRWTLTARSQKLCIDSSYYKEGEIVWVHVTGPDDFQFNSYILTENSENNPIALGGCTKSSILLMLLKGASRLEYVTYLMAP